MKLFLPSLLILLISINWGSAQTGRDKKVIPEPVSTESQSSTDRNDGLADISLPRQKDSWAIQILTTGGFSGRGRGDVLIESDGHISITENGTQHRTKLSASSRESLAKLVYGLTTSSIVNRKSLCNDCYKIVFAVYRRDGKRSQKQLTFGWDDSTFAELPADLKQLYSAALQVRENADTKRTGRTR